MSHNPCHKNEIGRINRAIGQLEGIKKMINDGRYCVEILQQIRAVESAIKSIEANVFTTHIESCIKNAMLAKDEDEINTKLDELKRIFKKSG